MVLSPRLNKQRKTLTVKGINQHVKSRYLMTVAHDVKHIFNGPDWDVFAFILDVEKAMFGCSIHQL